MEMHKGISVKASTNIAYSIIKHIFCKLVLKLSKKLAWNIDHIKFINSIPAQPSKNYYISQ